MTKAELLEKIKDIPDNYTLALRIDKWFMLSLPEYIDLIAIETKQSIGIRIIHAFQVKKQPPIIE